MRNIKSPYHNPNSLGCFEYIDCPLCGSEKYNIVYCRKQYINDEIRDVEIANVICKDCGFMFMNPRLKKEVLKGHYFKNSSGSVYHESFGDSRYGRLIRERKKFIEHYCTNLESGNFLDIGCGQGEMLKSLDLDTWKKYGIEPSEVILHTHKKGENIFNTTIEEFESEILYDAISCMSSLEHFVEPQNVLKTVFCLLKNTGYLFIEVPDSMKPKAQIAEFFSFEHLSHFTKNTLNKMLNICGFCVVDYDLNVSVSNIRCVAKKTDNYEERWNKDDLVLVIENYKRQRQLTISKIMENIGHKLNQLRSRNGKIAIYGAGFHTHFLLDTFDLSGLVQCIIDSDPKKAFAKFRQWSVYPPACILNIDVDAILISSHDYEEEIFHSVTRLNKNNVMIIRCYEE